MPPKLQVEVYFCWPLMSLWVSFFHPLKNGDSTTLQMGLRSRQLWWFCDQTHQTLGRSFMLPRWGVGYLIFYLYLFSQGCPVVQTPNNETFLLSLRWIRWTMHLHMGYVAAWIGSVKIQRQTSWGHSPVVPLSYLPGDEFDAGFSSCAIWRLAQLDNIARNIHQEAGPFLLSAIHLEVNEEESDSQHILGGQKKLESTIFWFVH